MAPVMRQAIVAIEDGRFYEHRGVDPRGTAARVRRQRDRQRQSRRAARP